jgi:hypothetical protein
MFIDAINFANKLTKCLTQGQNICTYILVIFLYKKKGNVFDLRWQWNLVTENYIPDYFIKTLWCFKSCHVHAVAVFLCPCCNFSLTI